MQVDKALDILEAFVKRENELGIADLAKLTKMSVSTTHRISSILLRRGYLIQPKKRARYFLGPKLLKFGPIVVDGMTVRDIAHPFLENLTEEINESVNMAVLEHDTAVIIDFIPSRKGLRYANRIGQRVILHSTGLGKTLLAHMKEEQLATFLKNNRLPAYTEYTITDPERLKQELDIIRSEGVALNREESELGGRSIAAPIKDKSDNVVAAFSTAIPFSRLDDKRYESFKVLVAHISRKISQAMKHID